MRQDSIVLEVRKNRQKIFKDNNYDLDKLFLNGQKAVEKLKQDGWIIADKNILKLKKGK